MAFGWVTDFHFVVRFRISPIQLTTMRNMKTKTKPFFRYFFLFFWKLSQKVNRILLFFFYWVSLGPLAVFLFLRFLFIHSDWFPRNCIRIDRVLIGFVWFGQFSVFLFDFFLGFFSMGCYWISRYCVTGFPWGVPWVFIESDWDRLGFDRVHLSLTVFRVLFDLIFLRFDKLNFTRIYWVSPDL